MGDIKNYLISIPQFSQRQNSLYDQMKASIPILNKFGLYDVADLLRQRVQQIDKRLGNKKEIK